MTSPVKVAYGKVNLKDAGGTLGCFRIEPPFQRMPAAQVGRRHGNPSSQPASIYPAAGGGFTTSNVGFDDGTVIMIQASRTRARMRYADGVIFLRLREQAAYIIVKNLLPTGRDSLLGDQFVAFAGCADVIGVDELKSMNFEVPRMLNGYLEQDEIDLLFRVETIREAITPAPSLVRVATSRGVELKAMATEPVRRLRLRK